MNIEQIKQTIPPAKYNEYLKYIDLEDVYLKQIKGNLGTKELSAQVNLSFNEKALLLELKDDYAKVRMNYQIKAKHGQKIIFNLSAEYLIVFHLAHRIPAEFFELYNKYSLPLQTFPYFRELVNSMISRMGLPSLVLPLRKFLIGENN